MGFLLSRKLVTPVLLTVGLLAMIGGDIEGGAWIDAFGIAYWVIAGWIMGIRRRFARTRPPAPDTAKVTARSPRARRSDGAGGAFSRLDPAWQGWLQGESQPQHGDHQ